MSRIKRLLIIGDTQAKPNLNLDYCKAIGRYIVDKKPDVIVHLGDGWDFPSLSSYDKHTKASEGRRLVEDLAAGDESMRELLKPLWALQARQKMNKKKLYSPRLVFTLGNHEDRLNRLFNQNAELEGVVTTPKERLEDMGWEVSDFLVPVEIGGIYFAHYMANPMTGKPYGGTALNIMKTIGRSFVMGHRQTLDIAMRPTINGSQEIGIICGACYPQDEAYKGPQGNNHFRGVVMLHEVENGFGLPMPVSLSYLMKHYLK